MGVFAFHDLGGSPVGTETTVPDLMTPKEVAAMLRTTEGSLATRRNRGSGPRFLRAGRRILYARADVLAWLQEDA